jgi:hypothetical protein
MRLLDPRFRYVSAAATDVSATWRRFGYSAQTNTERRAEQLRRLFGAGDARGETAALRELYLRVAAAGSVA